MVTLVEGRVSVGPVAPLPSPPRQGTDVTLVPGQRLTFAAGAVPRVDRPSMKQAVAWQRGQIILDHTPLSEAIEEMNRYSPVQLIIDQPSVLDLEVTGVFRSGDSVSFARAVAQAHYLRHGKASGPWRFFRFCRV